MPPLVLRYPRSIFLPRTFRPFQSLLPLLPTFSLHTSWHRHTFSSRLATTLIPRRRPDQIWAQSLAEEIVDVMEPDLEDLKEYKAHVNAVKEVAKGETFGATGAWAATPSVAARVLGTASTAHVLLRPPLPGFAFFSKNMVLDQSQSINPV